MVAFGIPPQQLKQQLSSRDFTDLKAYSKIEPFGASRDNFHAAILATMYGNAHKKESAPTFTTDDFMYRDPVAMKQSQEEKRQQSAQQFAALLKTKVKK